MKIVILRHGQSTANKNRIIQGHSDYPLTEEGIEQAKKIAKQLVNEYQFDAIYSSDLIRAAKTAQIVAKEFKIKKITYSDRLREFNLGKFQDRKNDDLSKEERAYIDSCWLEVDKKIPGGESVNIMKARIKEIFDEIVSTNHEESVILIVGHGGTAHHILKRILNVFPETDEWFINCSLNEISRENKDDPWKLIRFNGKYLDKNK